MAVFRVSKEARVRRDFLSIAAMKQSMKWQKRIGETKLTQTLTKTGRVWLTAAAIAAAVLGVRATGFLQAWELASLDLFFQLRPEEAIDDRIVIIGVREQDLQRYGWPLSDQTLVQLLNKIQAAQPKGIGLDLYRDFPVGQGHEQLVETYRSMPNLIGIEQLTDPQVPGVLPPQELAKQGKVGFNNIVFDPDRKVRRALLYWFDHNRQKHTSFSLKLALTYLKTKGIQPAAAPNQPKSLQLGKAVFPRFQSQDSVYVNADAGGYQTIVNFRGKAGHFQTIPMQKVMDGMVPPSLLHDRIVLIGSVATSLKDFSATPYSDIQQGAGLVTGVELQANFISHILGAALDGRAQLRSWHEAGEWLWIWAWAFVGTGISWKLRSSKRTAGAIALLTIGLSGTCYGAFLAGWIVPFIPALLALLGSTGVVIATIAHSEEELKRSKEFLHRVINAIPDPVFVKDQKHRWIVLNEAYSKFLGKPIADLIEKSDYEVFPEHEADVFWQQDELVFKYESEFEHEEEFTNSHGITYQIATKRSLHKDAAGNLFLVGVIRDITQRKHLENELIKATQELKQSNAELRLSQDRLSYLANHDALTGLPNRILLYEHLSQCIEVAKPNHQNIALLFLDLDGFKQINDSLGHGVGDLLLQAVAKRLTGCLRTSDMVARLGGDEFVVLLPGIAETQDVIRVAEKILKVLSQAFAISGQTLLITSSIGISLFPHQAEDLETLMQKADAAMYQAKKAGKNRFVIADSVPSDDQIALRCSEFDGRLRYVGKSGVPPKSPRTGGL
jgi:diguanylate cyclase (GGDEF)-like protein/PAS domain S-box-containing protein